MDTTAFITKFPTFNDKDKYPVEMIESWGESADVYLSRSWLLNGKRFEQAKMLLTAHLLCLADKASTDSSAVGATQSATEGSVSVTFAVPTANGGWKFWLSSTPYGMQLWALLSAASAGGVFIGGLPERKAIRKVGGVFI